MKSDTQKNLAKLPNMVALWSDRNHTPHEPWNKPADAKPIVVKAGEIGFFHVTHKLNVDHFNSTAGDGGVPATKAQIAAMLYGSLFGFDAPIADPDNYDADGNLKPSPISNIEDAKKDIVKFLGVKSNA